MKKNFSKVLSLVLCVVMIFTLAQISVQAASYNGTCGENLTWIFDSDTGVLEISGTGAMKNWSVSSTKPWDTHKTSIRTVIINDGVESIGAHAFGYFKSVSKVMIPDSVTGIGASAFKYCSIASFDMPDSIESIGNEAFYGCGNLKNIRLSENLIDMGYRVFTFCEALESITLPESLKTIGMYAFSYCTAMKNATIKGNTSFGNGIFYECSALEYIHISSKTKNINNSAFLNTKPYICAAVKGCDAEVFAMNNGHEFRLCDTHEEIKMVRGDVDGNGQCDGQDAFITDLIVKGALSVNDIGEDRYKAADCNFDGVINDLDVDIMIKSGLMIKEVEQIETAVTTDSEQASEESQTINIFDLIISIILRYIRIIFL